jgi:TetR/AcrR family transcriptional regulator, mexJK operon transcriptional repressor
MLHYRKFQRRSNLGSLPTNSGVELATPSLEPAEFKRGPGGRPTRQEAERRHAVLLETAIRLFLESGLDAVSIDEIAKQSAVAKRFIYARYRDKSELFVAAIEHAFADRLDVLHAFKLPHGRAAHGLLAFGRMLLDIALQPEAVALHRLFISSAPRFPDLAKLFIARNRHRFVGEVERVLVHYADKGEIDLAAPQLMAEQFFISVAGIPQRAALLGWRETPQEQERRLRTAIRLFLDGCRVHVSHRKTAR